MAGSEMQSYFQSGALPLTSCVALGELLPLSVSLFIPHCHL